MRTRRSIKKENPSTVEENDDEEPAPASPPAASNTKRKPRSKAQKIQKKSKDKRFEDEEEAGEAEEEIEETIHDQPPASPSPANLAEDVSDEEESAFEGDDDDDDDDDHRVTGRRTTASASRNKRSNKPPPHAQAPPQTNSYVGIITSDADLYSPYSGHLDKLYKGKALVRQFYGEGRQGQAVSFWIEGWQDWGLLPIAGYIDYGVFHDEEEAERRQSRLNEVRQTSPGCLESISDQNRHDYEPEEEETTCFIGDYRNPYEVKMKPAEVIACSQHGGMVRAEDDAQDAAVTGWLFHAGGIVLDMSWQPQPRQPSSEGKLEAQYLALAVIPQRDHAVYDYEAEASKPDFEKHGTVQLWEFHGQEERDTAVSHQTRLPRLKRTLCTDRGRARRVEWSPDGHVLAILSGYGEIIVVQPWDEDTAEEDYAENTCDFIKTPLATLALNHEPYNKATAMNWISPTQISVGYTDGSICLWSVSPSAALLVRHPTHHNQVLSLVSAQPSHPTILASYPIGGNAKLIDITCPDYETTESPGPLIATQPHLLAYSPHLRGFFMTMVSSHPLNDIVAFSPLGNFPVQKRVFQGESAPTAIALGRTHPFMLIGTLDGSLWAMNQAHSLFTPKGVNVERLRVLQHEYRPSSAENGSSGAARIVMGFEPDHVPVLTLWKTKASAPGRTHKKKKKKGKKGKEKPEAGVVAEEDGDADGEGVHQGRGVVHEPGSRVTAVEWNPNSKFGTWAAASFGDGLVRVIDLGLSPE